MAAVAVTENRSAPIKYRGTILTYSGTGAANQGDTLTTTAVPEHKTQRLAFVAVVYSAAPTQTGVTVTIDCGLGTAFDVLLTTGSANVQNTVYLPDGDIYLSSGDAILVSAPAAGGTITGTMRVVLEQN